MPGCLNDDADNFFWIIHRCHAGRPAAVIPRMRPPWSVGSPREHRGDMNPTIAAQTNLFVDRAPKGKDAGFGCRVGSLIGQRHLAIDRADIYKRAMALAPE